MREGSGFCFFEAGSLVTKASLRLAMLDGPDELLILLNFLGLDYRLMPPRTGDRPLPTELHLQLYLIA